MSRKRVLVIDDDPGVRLCMESILEGLGTEAYSARNGADGLGILNRCLMDVLFVDLRLRDGDGMSVAKQANVIQPRIPTVIVTGYPCVQSSVTALHHGFCDYVTKPVTRANMQAALARANAYAALFQDPGGRRPESGPFDSPAPSCELVGASRAMSKVLAFAKEVAGTDAPVLIHGEKGVGKALLARAIHQQSSRAAGPFVHLLCNAVREDQLEATLPPANDAGQCGRALDAAGSVWALAQRGSLFLEGRAGGPPPDVRVIASASQDLEAAAAEGRFSQELYFHLNIASVSVPPLRHRREDIGLLAEHLLDHFKLQLGPSAAKAALQFSAEAWDVLNRHDWPGNVDELANVLKRAVLLTKASSVDAAVVQEQLRSNRFVPASTETITVPLEGDLRKIQRQIIREVIGRCSGNKAAAARALGLHRKTIYRLLQEEDQPAAQDAAVSAPVASGQPFGPA